MCDGNEDDAPVNKTPAAPPQVSGDAEPALRILLAQAIAPLLASGGAFGVLILSFGWSYAWHWFGYWDIPFASLDLGVDLFVEYGRLVVLHFWLVSVAWLLAVVGVFLLLRLLKTGSLPYVLIALIAFFLPWFFSDTLGQKRAEADISALQAKNFTKLPEVLVFLNQDRVSDIPASELSSIGRGPNLCHRLVFRDTAGLWLTRLDSASQPSMTYFLATDAVTYMRLREPKGGNC